MGGWMEGGSMEPAALPDGSTISRWGDPGSRRPSLMERCKKTATWEWAKVRPGRGEWQQRGGERDIINRGPGRATGSGPAPGLSSATLLPRPFRTVSSENFWGEGMLEQSGSSLAHR